MDFEKESQHGWRMWRSLLINTHQGKTTERWKVVNSPSTNLGITDWAVLSSFLFQCNRIQRKELKSYNSIMRFILYACNGQTRMSKVVTVVMWHHWIHTEKQFFVIWHVRLLEEKILKYNRLEKQYLKPSLFYAFQKKSKNTNFIINNK